MREIMEFVSRHPFLVTSWISLLVAVFFTICNDLISKVTIVTSSEATRLINKEDAIVVDLRTRNDFRKGHIVGAINLLPSEIQITNVGKLEQYKAKPIIIVNGTGMQLTKPANALIKAGFKNVCILKEGIAGWSEKNLPLVRTE